MLFGAALILECLMQANGDSGAGKKQLPAALRAKLAARGIITVRTHSHMQHQAIKRIRYWTHNSKLCHSFATFCSVFSSYFCPHNASESYVPPRVLATPKTWLKLVQKHC